METLDVWEIIETREIADAEVERTFAFAKTEQVADDILKEVKTWKCDSKFRKSRKPQLKIYESIREFRKEWCEVHE